MTKRKTRGLCFLLALIMIMGLCVPAMAISENELSAAVNQSAKTMLSAVKTPQVGSIGGEWAVIGLARSGYAVPQAGSGLKPFFLSGTVHLFLQLPASRLIAPTEDIQRAADHPPVLFL